MTDERRYGEDEVREILDSATRPEGEHPSEGLTLAELKQIGSEVGLPPERIAAAASALDAYRAAPPRRTSLGMPVGVGRVVELPREPTEREWDALVAELRRTFAAHGDTSRDGSIRGWTNGNLHAYVEPEGAGFRLRLGTLKGSAAPMNGLGFGGILMGLVVGVLLGLEGAGLEALAMGGFFVLFGVATLVSNLLGLRRWAAEREAQMKHVADRAVALLSDPADDSG